MRHLLMPLDALTAISMPIYTQFKKTKTKKMPHFVPKQTCSHTPPHTHTNTAAHLHTHKPPTYFTSTTDCMYRYTQTQVSMHKHNCTTHTTHGDHKKKMHSTFSPAEYREVTT